LLVHVLLFGIAVPAQTPLLLHVSALVHSFVSSQEVLGVQLPTGVQKPLAQFPLWHCEACEQEAPLGYWMARTSMPLMLALSVTVLNAMTICPEALAVAANSRTRALYLAPVTA
jgi:hypothetical protein